MPDHSESIRVLIADDDRRVRHALSTLLAASSGFHVVGAAATAVSALTLAREHRPTVALIGGVRSSALAAGASGFFDKDGATEVLASALRAIAP